MNAATTMNEPGTTTGQRWVEIILTSGGFVAFLKLLQTGLGYLFNRKSKLDVLEGVERLRSIYHAMEKCLDNKCQRVLLLSAHNSGGIPSPLTPFYMSAIHWATNDPAHRAALSGYTKIRIDSDYTNMLLQMQAHGDYHFDMDKNEGSMLRKFYESEGVADSYLCFVGIYKNNFVYMSFASFSEKFTDTEQTRFRLIANEIKNLME